MADFNINLKYSGMPKQAFQARQKAIQAQRSIDKEAITGVDTSKNSINVLKQMSKQLDQMIFVLKSISSGQGMGGGGYSPGGSSGIDSAISNRGRSRLFTGAAALGIVGYAIHKINEIGNAFMERAGAQMGNVGLSGFGFSSGVYNAAEIGAGMKAYAMGRGRFSRGVRPNKAALDVGAIYGLSAEETLGMAGRFERSGANYEMAVNQGLGAGIQADLPILLRGMSDIMEGAIREGINASEMGKTLSKDIASLALRSPGGVQTAMGIIQKGESIRKGLARGEMGTLEGMYGAQATRNILMQRLTGENRTQFINDLFQKGDITGRQMDLLYQLNPNANYQDLLRQGGGELANYLFKRTAAESGPALQRESMRLVQKQYGTGATGKQRWLQMQSAGLTMGVGEVDTLWRSVAEGDMGDKTAQGAITRQTLNKQVKDSIAYMSKSKEQMFEKMLFTTTKDGKMVGAEFARVSLEMEKSLIEIAKVGAPAAVKALEGLTAAAGAVSSALGILKSKIDKSPTAQKVINYFSN